MSEANENVLACWRVADVPSPRPGAVRARCSTCGADVYVMPRNLAAGLRLLCRPCAVARMTAERDYEVRDARDLHRPG